MKGSDGSDGSWQKFRKNIKACQRKMPPVRSTLRPLHWPSASNGPIHISWLRFVQTTSALTRISPAFLGLSVSSEGGEEGGGGKGGGRGLMGPTMAAPHQYSVVGQPMCRSTSPQRHTSSLQFGRRVAFRISVDTDAPRLCASPPPLAPPLLGASPHHRARGCTAPYLLCVCRKRCRQGGSSR